MNNTNTFARGSKKVGKELGLTDGRDGTQHLPNMQLVQYSGLTSRV